MTTQDVALPDTLPTKAGFRTGKKGVHNSRTLSFGDLSTLLAHVPADATNTEYRAAIRDDNVLGKGTGSTRRYIGQRLSQLYGLDADIPLFRVFRHLWNHAGEGKPLLAMLLALARDPLLRLTAPPVLGLREGETFDKQLIQEELRKRTGDRFNETSITKISQMTASSWTQSGHLVGRYNKVRQRPVDTPETTAYALFLGYAAGLRGSRLFDTFWTMVLDRPAHDIHEHARQASRHNLLTYRQTGNVVSVDFSPILTAEEQEHLREQD